MRYAVIVERPDPRGIGTEKRSASSWTTQEEAERIKTRWEPHFLEAGWTVVRIVQVCLDRGVGVTEERAMPMKTAVWKDCPGIRNEGRTAHYMRDHCWSCAPFWERFPSCPHCGGKLMREGRTRCKGCQAFVKVDPDTEERP